MQFVYLYRIYFPLKAMPNRSRRGDGCTMYIRTVYVVLHEQKIIKENCAIITILWKLANKL